MMYRRLEVLRVLALSFAALAGFLWSIVAAVASDPLQAGDYKMAGDETYTRVVVNFDKALEPDWFLLRGPHRLVIDLPKTDFSFDSRELAARGLVSNVRYGNMDRTRSRIVLSMVGPFTVDDIQIIANEASEGYRLVVELRPASEDVFEAGLRARIARSDLDKGSATSDAAHGKPADKRFTIALDAGHGGADGGTRGINGTVEKTITLVFALELAKRIKETGNYDVVLTREKDRFLRLDERVRIAREKGADLFVSIHADAIGLPGMRGATVYTVSDKASDAEAAATAARENLSDEIAGMVVEEEKAEVADILVDLIRRETHSFSIRFARTLLGELSQTMQLVPNPHRYAGFRVLRAPDIPSILLELGYLSNPKDEAQMRDPKWRAETADAVISAIRLFADTRAGAGG